MEEELKEVKAEEVKAEEVKEEPAEQQSGMQPNSKAALVSFILAVVGFGVSFAWLAAIAGIVLGAISLHFNKKNQPETEQQPFRVFAKIAKPVAIVDIILGAVMFVVYLVILIVTALAALAEAGAAA